MARGPPPLGRPTLRQRGRPPRVLAPLAPSLRPKAESPSQSGTMQPRGPSVETPGRLLQKVGPSASSTSTTASCSDTCRRSRAHLHRQLARSAACGRRPAGAPSTGAPETAGRPAHGPRTRALAFSAFWPSAGPAAPGAISVVGCGCPLLRQYENRFPRAARRPSGPHMRFSAIDVSINQPHPRTEPLLPPRPRPCSGAPVGTPPRPKPQPALAPRRLRVPMIIFRRVPASPGHPAHLRA